MRYFPIHFLERTLVGRDVLGNPVFGLRESSSLCPEFIGRFTEWTAEETQLVGRDVTQTQRKLLTDAPLSACKAAAAVRAGRQQYRITSIKDLQGRWRMLYLERWNQATSEQAAL